MSLQQGDIIHSRQLLLNFYHNRTSRATGVELKLNKMNIHYGIDFGKGDSKTVIAQYGMRCGKTFFMKMWIAKQRQDLLSKQLIRRLAAEAIINISINS
jgi:hypothetical protein